jgi:hypothetical protein
MYAYRKEDEIYEEASNVTPSVSQTTLPVQSNTQTTKKRKLSAEPSHRIDESNVTRFKVLKRLNIQNTRTNHHIKYLERCINTKTIPKSLRVNLTPQVPVINSLLQIEWEEAHITFGLKLCSILLQYWKNRKEIIIKEMETVNTDLNKITSQDQINLITDIIAKITLNVEKELNNKKKSPGQ